MPKSVLLNLFDCHQTNSIFAQYNNTMLPDTGLSNSMNKPVDESLDAL